MSGAQLWSPIRARRGFGAKPAAVLVSLVVATSCGSGERYADAGQAVASARPGNWVEVARLDGTYTSHLPDNSNLTCGRGAVCEPNSFPPFRTYEGPLRVTCTTDASYLRVYGGNVLSDVPPDLQDGFAFGCYPPGSGIGGRYISFMPGGQVWGVYLGGIHQRDGSQLGYGESESYSFSFQVWKGRWREPVCGRRGSGHPDGHWYTCIGKTAVDERRSSADPL